MYRVVLVDDEQIILQGLQRAFPWAEYDCEVAGVAMDGQEGLKLIREVKPDLLLTDICMPNMDGLTMIAALKSAFPVMQVAVLTAYRDFDYAQKALNLGVCRYLLKPSNMEQLREAISTMKARLDEATPMPAVPEPEAEPAESSGEAGAFIARAAMDYIRQHYTEHLTLSDVADHVYVSQWHLSKLINRHLQQSFLDIINTLRVERAKELLADPACRVHDIAALVGYSDVAHFSRIFKKHTGQSPLDYRAGVVPLHPGLRAEGTQGARET